MCEANMDRLIEEDDPANGIEDEYALQSLGTFFDIRSDISVSSVGTFCVTLLFNCQGQVRPDRGK